ncbi:MAG: UDP-N-acetylmuramoyl-L-alanine--D-glutamate ligase, partial [Candidatus Fermentibacteria bacterium]|nr:UDP-N-acetylmuramoyl-L-alanine--D-glutamate ligase [Candidatus Fermentibacteria bacterium]
MRLFKKSDDLQGKNVLVMGLGTKDGGLGAALYACGHGAKVTVTDLQNESALKEALTELKDLNIRFVLRTHRESDFTDADLVIRNPGIKRSNRYLAAAAEANVPVESPVGIFSEKRETNWTGITGTKGKSFTTHLVSHILNTAGMKTVAAGNNCVSPLRFVDDKNIYPVLELSSWQLAEMDIHRKSPH